jgi:hypothetical protein
MYNALPNGFSLHLIHSKPCCALMKHSTMTIGMPIQHPVESLAGASAHRFALQLFRSAHQDEVVLRQLSFPDLDKGSARFKHSGTK